MTPYPNINNFLFVITIRFNYSNTISRLILPEQKINNKKNHLISWLVFLPTLIIVLFTLILGMFPALIIAFSDKVRFPVEINILEPGSWMFPILISNTIIFTIIVLHQKNKLPHMLNSLFKFILNFEVSHRTALVLIGILIGSYAILTVEELYTEEPWEDFDRGVDGGLEAALQNWSIDDLTFHAKVIPYFFGYLSMELFGSYRVAPFIASIVCLCLTYLITVQLSKKRFAGIVALGIVLQSGNFLIYDTTITYPILWIMFYLLSIYFIFKSWPISSISFIPAVFSHILSVGLFPLSILIVAVLDLPKRKKILLLSSYFALIVVGLILIFTQIIPFYLISSFDLSKIISGFAIVLSQFRYDSVIVVFLLPLVVCLFLISKKGISNANAPLILIGGLILMIAFVPVLTTMGNTPYRMLPLVFFFAIGVGTLLSKKINLQDELLSNKL